MGSQMRLISKRFTESPAQNFGSSYCTIDESKLCQTTLYGVLNEAVMRNYSQTLRRQPKYTVMTDEQN